MHSPADLIQHVTEKGYREGAAALNEAQRVIFLVVELDAMASMEGLPGFYDSATGELAAQCALALERIGATESARLIREANELFPDGTPQSDRATRREQLRTLPEETLKRLASIGSRFLSYPDGLGGKLEHFAAQHRDELRS